MLKKPHYLKSGGEHRNIGNYRIVGSNYPLINANDTDLSDAQKAGNALEKKRRK